MIHKIFMIIKRIINKLFVIHLNDDSYSDNDDSHVD